MKNLIKFSAFLIFSISLLAQSEGYFPSTAGHLWFYKTTVLDSASQPIDSLTLFGVDEYIGDEQFEGKSSRIIRTKTGTVNTIGQQPFLDTLRVSTVGKYASEYLSISAISSLLGLTDSLDLGDSINLDFDIQALIGSLQGWYDTYDFTYTTLFSRTIFRKDTTFTFDSTEVPLRLEYTSRRVGTREITTELGKLNTMAFVNSFRLSINTGIIPIPIVSLPDSVYIAQNNWIVRRVLSPQQINLSDLASLIGQEIDVPTINFPGRKLEAVSPFVSNEEYQGSTPNTFELKQNYPNPFNPSTTIEFALAQSDNITLIVYDMLGNEITRLIDGQTITAGVHSVIFSTEGLAGLSSGVYYYRLQGSGYAQTKKLLLLK